MKLFIIAMMMLGLHNSLCSNNLWNIFSYGHRTNKSLVDRSAPTNSDIAFREVWIKNELYNDLIAFKDSKVKISEGQEVREQDKFSSKYLVRLTDQKETINLSKFDYMKLSDFSDNSDDEYNKKIIMRPGHVKQVYSASFWKYWIIVFASLSNLLNDEFCDNVTTMIYSVNDAIDYINPISMCERRVKKYVKGTGRVIDSFQGRIDNTLDSATNRAENLLARVTDTAREIDIITRNRMEDANKTMYSARDNTIKLAFGLAGAGITGFLAYKYIDYKFSQKDKENKKNKKRILKKKLLKKESIIKKD